MNRAINSAAAQQRRIGGVDKDLQLPLRHVALHGAENGHASPAKTEPETSNVATVIQIFMVFPLWQALWPMTWHPLRVAYSQGAEPLQKPQRISFQAMY